jgi:hypothetical protein
LVREEMQGSLREELREADCLLRDRMERGERHNVSHIF